MLDLQSDYSSLEIDAESSPSERPSICAYMEKSFYYRGILVLECLIGALLFLVLKHLYTAFGDGTS